MLRGHADGPEGRSGCWGLLLDWVVRAGCYSPGCGGPGSRTSPVAGSTSTKPSSRSGRVIGSVRSLTRWAHLRCKPQVRGCGERGEHEGGLDQSAQLGQPTVQVLGVAVLHVADRALDAGASRVGGDPLAGAPGEPRTSKDQPAFEARIGGVRASWISSGLAANPVVSTHPHSDGSATSKAKSPSPSQPAANPGGATSAPDEPSSQPTAQPSSQPSSSSSPSSDDDDDLAPLAKPKGYEDPGAQETQVQITAEDIRRVARIVRGSNTTPAQVDVGQPELDPKAVSDAMDPYA